MYIQINLPNYSIQIYPTENKVAGVPLEKNPFTQFILNGVGTPEYIDWLKHIILQNDSDYQEFLQKDWKTILDCGQKDPELSPWLKRWNQDLGSNLYEIQRSDYMRSKMKICLL